MKQRVDQRFRRLIALGLALLASFAPSAPLLAAPDLLRPVEAGQRRPDDLSAALKPAGLEAGAGVTPVAKVLYPPPTESRFETVEAGFETLKRLLRSGPRRISIALESDGVSMGTGFPTVRLNGDTLELSHNPPRTPWTPIAQASFRMVTVLPDGSLKCYPADYQGFPNVSVESLFTPPTTGLEEWWRDAASAVARAEAAVGDAAVTISENPPGRLRTAVATGDAAEIFRAVGAIRDQWAVPGAASSPTALVEALQAVHAAARRAPEKVVRLSDVLAGAAIDPKVGIQIANYLRTPGIELRLAMIGEGQQLRRHRHDEMDELYLMLQGRAVMQIGSATKSIGPGAVVKIAAGKDHTVLTTEPVELLFCFATHQHEYHRSELEGYTPVTEPESLPVESVVPTPAANAPLVPGGDLGVVIRTVESGQSFTLKKAQGPETALFVLDGTGEIALGEDAPQPLQPGSGIGLWSRRTVQVRNTGAEPLTLFVLTNPNTAGLEEHAPALANLAETRQALAMAREVAVGKVADAWKQARGDIDKLVGRPDERIADVLHPTARRLLFTHMFEDVPWVVLLGFHVTIGITEPEGDALRVVLEKLAAPRDAYALITPEEAKALLATPTTSNVIPVKDRAHLLQLLKLTERDLSADLLLAATQKTQALLAAQAGLESGA